MVKTIGWLTLIALCLSQLGVISPAWFGERFDHFARYTGNVNRQMDKNSRDTQPRAGDRPTPSEEGVESTPGTPEQSPDSQSENLESPESGAEPSPQTPEQSSGPQSDIQY